VNLDIVHNVQDNMYIILEYVITHYKQKLMLLIYEKIPSYIIDDIYI